MNIYSLLLVQAQTAEEDTLIQMLQEETSMSFLDILMQGGFLMLPLFILSITTIYVAAEGGRTKENKQMDVNQTLNAVETLLKPGRQQRAIQYCEEYPKPQARILKAGIQKLGRPIRDIEDSIKNAGKKEIFYLEIGRASCRERV